VALPLIPDLEVLVAELIALVLLILAGARLILRDWHLLRSSDGDYFRPLALPRRPARGPDSRGKANPKTQLRQKGRSSPTHSPRGLRESREVAQEFATARKA
jgi:hypothetical protein